MRGMPERRDWRGGRSDGRKELRRRESAARRAWTRGWAGALALLLAALAAPLQAGTARRLSDAELVERAEWIGVGAVRASRSEWRARRLWTFVELEVSETLKGAERGSMTVVLPGGMDRARGISQVVPGMPSLLPRGTRMLVFGERSELSAGGMKPVSLLQGMRLLPAAAANAGGAPGAPAAQTPAALRERLQVLIGALRSDAQVQR
jgi:hypothetical protein